MALETELATFMRRLPELQEKHGRYALVRGDEVDVFCCYPDALKAGYAKYGLDSPFMVQEIPRPPATKRDIVVMHSSLGY